jgi:hypothetical protein
MISDSSLSKIAMSMKSQAVGVLDDDMSVETDELGGSIQDEMLEVLSDQAIQLSEIYQMYGEYMPRDVKQGYIALINMLDALDEF